MSTENKAIGHDIDSKIRTIDVEIDRNVSFEQLMLSPPIIAGLTSNNFIYPSPIQLKAIPLARCGKDLFVQAKSGTGKTLVFTVVILERVVEKSKTTGVQSLVIVPTREIALQVTGVIEAVGKKIQNFNVVSCIGGTEIEKDRKRIMNAKCVVGTPGRILHIIRNRFINPENVKLVVLDEADKLLNDSFTSDIEEIMQQMSKRQQTLIVSATLDATAQKNLLQYMHNPLGVTPKKEVPILLGITQFMYQLPKMENVIEEMQKKLESLVRVLSNVDFNQCLVFTNSQSRAESYANGLHEKGFLAEFISGALDQTTRTKVFERILQSPTCNIIVTTDLLARGIDAERVNLVVNMELPSDQCCYLHRIGRAGRFGSLGTAITFVSEGEEEVKFRNVLCDEEYPVYKVKQGEETKISEAIETGKVSEMFQFLTGCEKTNNDNLNGNMEKQKNVPVGDYKKIFDLYRNFTDTPSTPSPSVNPTSNIFLQKIVEMNLYGDDTDDKGDKTNENDSTKSNIDSGSSSDDLHESDINNDNVEYNLNTESANERVDSFLDTLDNLSQELQSESSAISATTYTVTNKHNEPLNDSSGSTSDDESSSSSSSTNSTASNRGSDSYQNEIDDTNGSKSDTEDEDQEEFFEAAENLERPSTSKSQTRRKSNSVMSLHSNLNAYNRWNNMYWTQATHILDYVNYWRVVQQKYK